MKSKHILIVGGTGFIGYNLAKFLLKKKYSITSLSTRKPIKKRKLKKVKYILEDVNKIKKIIKIKDQFTYVINLAGYVDHKNKRLTYNSHFKGCVNLVKIFRETKIKAFLQVGSSLEYGKLKSPQYENKGLTPVSHYGRSKFLATKFLLKSFKFHKFPAIIIRAYQVYGPRQDNNRLIPIVITNCLKNNSFFCSEGSQLRDFLYIDDFILAIYKALKCKKAVGKIINVGYGQPYKVKDAIIKIKKIIKQGRPLFNKIKLRKDENKILFPSILKALKILQWRPTTSFSNGIKKTILDYKKNTKGV